VDEPWYRVASTSYEFFDHAGIVLDPTPDGHMVYGETPLRHDLLQVTIGERASIAGTSERTKE
jgi:hypothetical protein